MKNLILAAVSASALFALSACGGDAAEEPAADTTVVETETVEPAPMAAETAAMDPAADAAADAAGATADAAADAAGETADAAADAAGDAAAAGADAAE